MQQQVGEHVRGVVRSYLTECCFADMSMIGDESSFMDMAVLDSVGFLELVAFLERTFAITIEDSEIIPDNMDSIGRIGAFIERKRTG